MVLDDIKDRLKGDLAQLWDKIQESSTYISLKDRYDSLSPTRQKLVSLAVVSVFLIFVFMIPLGTYWSSSDHVTEYEEKRDLVRELLRAAKESKEHVASFAQPSTADVETQAKQAMAQLNLLPTQIKGVMTAPSGGNLINNSIVAGIVEVSTDQLNIKQVVSLGTSLVRIQGTKLKDLILNANAKDPRYFDAIFRIVVFKSDGGGGGFDGPPPPNNSGGIPPPPPPPPPPGAAKKLRGNK